MEDFLIGDERIDAEHAQILNTLDEIKNANDSDLSGLIFKLKNHIVIHFIDEEYVFTKQYNMPKEYIDRHIQEHHEIRENVLNILRDEANVRFVSMKLEKQLKTIF